MALSKSTLEKDIADILKDADLSTLSAKKVRKQLEGKHNVDLTARKKEVDEIVMHFVNDPAALLKLQKAAPTPEPVKEKSNGKAENGAAKLSDSEGSHSGSESSDFEACEDAGPPRSKPAKKKSESGAANDEDLARQLQAEEGGGRRTRAGQTRRPQTVKRKKEAKPKDANAKKRKTSYNKHCVLSPALAQVMGKNRMPRCDIVKNMWVIIKERNLQDPKNKSFMLCDEELQSIFKRKRVKTFGMMKFLSDHIFDPDNYEMMYGTLPPADDDDAQSNNERNDEVIDSDSD